MAAVFVFTLIHINIYLPCKPLIRLDSKKRPRKELTLFKDSV